MTEPRGPLDVQADVPWNSGVMPTDYVRGLLRGMSRQDRKRRRERRFWLGVVLVLVAYAFLAGRTSAAPRSAPLLSPVPTDGALTGASPPQAWDPPAAQRPSSGVEGSDALSPTGGIGQPASYCKPGHCETAAPRPRIPGGSSIVGDATWYAWHPGQAAAGPALRAFLGPDWRGQTVTVVAPGCTCRPIAVVLTDWCLCRDDRIIDLDSRSFAALAPLATGVTRVVVYAGDWTR